RFGFPFDAERDYGFGVDAIAAHPSGDGLCVVHHRLDPKHLSAPGVKTTTCLAEVSAHGETRRTQTIEDAASHNAAKLACARDTGMLCVEFRTEERDTELLALIQDPASAGALRVAYRASLGPGRTLAQDQEGRRAFVVGEHDGGVEIVPLGPTPPVLAARPSL